MTNQSSRLDGSISGSALNIRDSIFYSDATIKLSTLVLNNVQADWSGSVEWNRAEFNRAIVSFS